MYAVAPLSFNSISFQSVSAMASSDQNFSDMPCENTCIISAASASQYQKELETQKKFKSGKPLSSAESAFRMKALKVYGQTLAPKWQHKGSQGQHEGRPMPAQRLPKMAAQWLHTDCRMAAHQQHTGSWRPWLIRNHFEEFLLRNDGNGPNIKINFWPALRPYS